MKLSPPLTDSVYPVLAACRLSSKPEIWGQMQANDQTTGTIAAAAGLLSQISFFSYKKILATTAAAIHCIEKILMWTLP